MLLASLKSAFDSFRTIKNGNIVELFENCIKFFSEMNNLCNGTNRKIKWLEPTFPLDFMKKFHKNKGNIYLTCKLIYIK